MIFANSTHNVEYISPAEMLRLWYVCNYPGGPMSQRPPGRAPNYYYYYLVLLYKNWSHTLSW